MHVYEVCMCLHLVCYPSLLTFEYKSCTYVCLYVCMYVHKYVCISVCCIRMHCSTYPYLRVNVHTRLFRLRCCFVAWPKCGTVSGSGWCWAPSTLMAWWSSTVSSWRTGRPTLEHSRHVDGRWRSYQSEQVNSVLLYDVLIPGSICTPSIHLNNTIYTRVRNYVHMYRPS